MAKKKPKPVVASRRLVDRVVGQPTDGALVALLATTYEMQADFLETDFLPSLLGLGAWDDRGWASRIAIEKSLAGTQAAAIFTDASCYRGRPRSLRLAIRPVALGGRILHAKVTLLVYARVIRLIVASANLTEPGYRRNREVAAVLSVSAKDHTHASLIRGAIAGLRAHLADQWDEAAEKAAALATARMDEWGASAGPDDDAWFAWSGDVAVPPLWQQVLQQWPVGEPVRAVTIVSPFWSDEHGDGPVARLLDALRERDALAPGASVRLLTEAMHLGGEQCRPILPEGYRTWQPTGVTATAAAVDPKVTRAEVDGVGDVLPTRRLHAKIVLIEGEKHSVAYLGSANFTRHGWGFPLGLPANLEAGVILRARGGDRDRLRALIPATAGPVVTLDGAVGEALVAPTAIEPAPPWPAFIRSITLVPVQVTATERQLALEITLVADEVEGAWAVALASEPALDLARGEPGAPLSVRVDLSPEVLNRVLVDQDVSVSWWAQAEGVRFPVNVALDARDELPIAPGTTAPGEALLLAYYQGRIRWEALYPEPGAPGPGEAAPTTGADSEVDTSHIQAYQVREFVEALRGLRDDLKAASSSPSTMRLALIGPISPLALARHVVDAIARGARSPTAGAFQLAEILACLDEAGQVTPELGKDAWRDLLAQARALVASLLGEVQAAHPDQFPADGPFRRFQASLERFHQQGKI